MPGVEVNSDACDASSGDTSNAEWPARIVVPLPIGGVQWTWHQADAGTQLNQSICSSSMSNTQLAGKVIHLDDACSIRLLARDLPRQLALRLATSTAFQVRFPGTQFFEAVAQGRHY